MNKIRILRIQSRICIGGPALNSILLSAHIDPDKYETLLVGGRLEEGESSMEAFAESKNVNLHIIEEMGRSINWTNDFRALWRLVRLIRSYKPHIVHTHTAKAGAIGRLAAFLCGVPIRVHTFHGHVFLIRSAEENYLVIRQIYNGFQRGPENFLATTAV